MHALRLYTLALAALAVVASARAEEPREEAGPLQGAVWRGRAFAAVRADTGAVFACFAPLAGGPAVKSPQCARVEGGLSCRWSVSNSHFWVIDAFTSSGGRPPPAMTVRDALERYRLDDLVKGKLITAAGADDEFPNEAFLEEFDGPLSYARLLSFVVQLFDYRLHFDYLPAAEDEVRLFLLCNVADADRLYRGPAARTIEPADRITDGQAKRYEDPHWSFTVHRFRNEWDAAKKRWKDGTWERLEKVEVGFKEPFRVLGKGDDYYFVTDSGKLYRAPKLDKGADRKMAAVWDDCKRPVAAFITDADADRSFLFCKPDKDGKGVYFEMNDKPDPQPYDASKIPAAKPEDPLPAVLAYAKILLADKKIKDKEKEK